MWKELVTRNLSESPEFASKIRLVPKRYRSVPRSRSWKMSESDKFLSYLMIYQIFQQVAILYSETVLFAPKYTFTTHVLIRQQRTYTLPTYRQPGAYKRVH